MRRAWQFAPVALLACGPATTTDDPDTDTDTLDVDPTQNVWFIDDEELPGLYASLNCELSGDRLRLSGVDSGGMGSIQLLLGERPTANGTLSVTSDLGAVAVGQIYLSIGRDREGDNQYVAQSGSVSVTVVTTAPQEINLSFDDLPATTSAAATADLSGDVGARAGTFVGACDFDDLVP